MLYSNQRTFKSLGGILLPFSHVPSFDDEQLPYGMVARPNRPRSPVHLHQG